MKNLIYITGITATGKTTNAIKLSQRLKGHILSTDAVYNIVGKIIHFKEPAKLVMPERWKDFEDFRELKFDAFRKLVEKKIKPDYQGDIVVEGFTLFFEEEREIVESILRPDSITMLKLDLSFEKWTEFRLKKYGKEPSVKSFVDLNSMFEPPTHFYSIKDPKSIDVHYLEYQRTGFTDKKIERLQLKSNEISEKTIFDFGCNSGWIGEHCLRMGARDVVGFDRNWRFLEDARKRKLQVKLFDLEDLHKLKTKCDVSLCISTLHYLADKEKCIKDIANLTTEMFVLEIPVLQEKGLKQELRYGNYFVPTEELVMYWLLKHFKKVEKVGESVPPDRSFRLIFKAYK